MVVHNIAGAVSCGIRGELLAFQDTEAAFFSGKIDENYSKKLQWCINCTVV